MLPAKVKFVFTLITFAVSICHAKTDGLCELAAFIEDVDGKNPRLIDSGKTRAEIKSCDEENKEICKNFVEKQVIEGTGGGNFSLISDDKDMYTVGDVLCDKADAIEENVQNKYVQIYWRLCSSSWEKTSFKMPQPLCCDDGLHIPCKL
ncbi:uncharacterized protein [Parasteatoda tepidariorum]|uniref:uncharacterized protein isoform X1 n=1 Tax=Parasteatoda tepidariorum TaxID=114398 RepID=UPI00077F8EDB|nr:uncharacterized protein LOC107457444 [Parasteatoda tepidariorum]